MQEAEEGTQMKFKNTIAVHVYFMRGKERLYMGQLVLNERKIFFEYNNEFIKTGLELSPFKLPAKPGVVTCDDRQFDGLFGVFNDSLPDGWGRLLIDRKLMKMSLNPSDLSPIDRLCYVGSLGMGALIYEPETKSHLSSFHNDFDEIYNEALKFQENNDDRFVDDLLAMSGSSAGARPKIVVAIGEENWIIKFRSQFDLKDTGHIEYAYNLMAKNARLDAQDAKLFQSKKGPGYFGAKRFDRISGNRLHMHTISGLLHIDHRVPCLDYSTVMKATLFLTKDTRECKKQFRAAVFNVLSHNRDDHAKNFSFLMDENGIWRVSPAYDQTFSSGPSGEHCCMIMGEGKIPTLSHLLQLAEVGGIKKQQAIEIISEVKAAVSKWDSFAKNADVSVASTKKVKAAINSIAKHVFV